MYHECRDPGARNITGCFFDDLEARVLKHLVGTAGQMATTGNQFPEGFDASLPFDDTRIIGSAVFNEKQFTTTFEHSSHLGNSPIRIGNGAQRPGTDDGVELMTIT